MNIVRIKDALHRLGDSRSPFYDKIARGLLPRPIKISERAAGLPDYEIDAINAARISGASEREIKALVKRLHAKRADLKKVEAPVVPVLPGRLVGEPEPEALHVRGARYLA